MVIFVNNLKNQLINKVERNLLKIKIKIKSKTKLANQIHHLSKKLINLRKENKKLKINKKIQKLVKNLIKVTHNKILLKVG